MYIKYVYIFSYKVYICKRNTIMIKCKVHPKFPLTFLIFEYCNFYLLKLTFILFVSFQEKPSFSHTSMNNTVFIPCRRDIRFHNFNYIDYTIVSVIFYFIFLLSYVVTNVSVWLNSTNIDWAPPLSQVSLSVLQFLKALGPLRRAVRWLFPRRSEKTSWERWHLSPCLKKG